MPSHDTYVQAITSTQSVSAELQNVLGYLSDFQDERDLVGQAKANLDSALAWLNVEMIKAECPPEAGSSQGGSASGSAGADTPKAPDGDGSNAAPADGSSSGATDPPADPNARLTGVHTFGAHPKDYLVNTDAGPIDRAEDWVNENVFGGPHVIHSNEELNEVLQKKDE